MLWLKRTDVTGTPPPPFCGSGLDCVCLNAPGRRVLRNVLCPAPGHCDALSADPRAGLGGSISREAGPGPRPRLRQAELGVRLARGLMPRGCGAGFHGKLSKEAAWF